MYLNYNDVWVLSIVWEHGVISSKPKTNHDMIHDKYVYYSVDISRSVTFVLVVIREADYKWYELILLLSLSN